MKPILNIQIPSKKVPKNSVELLSKVARSLKDKLVNDYNVIVTPTEYGINVQGGTVVNLTIDPTTNFDEFFKKLDELAKPKPTDSFHARFMPPEIYLNRSYDGDQDFNPEKCLDNYWINMISPINQSGIPNEEILVLIKNHNIDPNTIESIKLNDKYAARSLVYPPFDNLESIIISVKKEE